MDAGIFFVAFVTALGYDSTVDTTTVRLFRSINETVTTNLGVQEVSYLGSRFLFAGSPTLDMQKITGSTQLQEDTDNVAHEHVILDEDSAMRTILDAFYIQVD